MEIYHIRQETTPFPLPPSVMALGYFDGLHLGHQTVLEHTVRISRENHWVPSLLTFHPHPREVLAGPGKVTYLTSLDQRLQLFEQHGMEQIFLVQFDQAFANLSPQEFVHQYVLDFHAKYVVSGFDYTFGQYGRGNAAMLQEFGEQLGFGVDIVPPILYEGDKVSSTRIRQLIQEGKIEAVPPLLGKPFQLVGTVIIGDQRGRTLGFPTANLRLTTNYILPKHGVYACKVHWNGREYEAVMNVGKKPTFLQGNEVDCEVHLIDFNGDLYGETMVVDLFAFIREEQKFPNREALISQIKMDVEQVRRSMLY
ncbi:bifunctional riboflavin kinase/FAD synthetase [Rubeoparvulum massiliense]|uniref:bifunctional riboflavin kinase/FAD synthetase n=1 Tax=Rubeoparvulum massiliense TaxID=1631346 RepID=UPI00065E366C|nr:bifunctional riboflavin kinase/FAD synthetase [Rubeoparvulum massiliense]